MRHCDTENLLKELQVETFCPQFNINAANAKVTTEYWSSLNGINRTPFAQVNTGYTRLEFKYSQHRLFSNYQPTSTVISIMIMYV